jgi:3alpha(or 20beta)-hydroxysteroid dehydrogenase
MVASQSAPGFVLDGKVAIVTGAANGQGAAAARLFAKNGAKVVVADIAATAGKAVADELGPDGVFIEHDVSKADSWAMLIEETLKRFGKISVLVNNAAIYDWKSLPDTDEAFFERIWRVNQLGIFLGMKSVIAAMTQEGGGSIINISSVGGMGGYPGIFAYATSKWAIRGMTKCAARDLGQFGIRVNTILPGVIETKMIEHLPDETKAGWLSTMPLGRLGTPDDVAKVVLFLASDASAYMTGTDIVVDAGMIA